MTLKASIIIIAVALASITSCSANDIEGWFGEENSGGGIAVADINKNGILDLVVFNIDHLEGGNIGYYRVGFDIKPDMKFSRWSDPMMISGWFGESTAAGDIAIADLNKNGLPDLIIFHIDNQDGGNSGYYRIGWDLNAKGEVSRWDVHLSDPIKVPGWFGDETQGGGIAIADLDKNGLPDLIIFHIDHPDNGNIGYYRIGWNLNDKGEVDWDPRINPPIKVPGWFGNDNQGGDIAVADLNQNGKPDLIVFNIDHPDNGNKAYYRIGWDVNPNGDAKQWDQQVALPGWMGDVSSAAGIDITTTVSNGAGIVYFTVARNTPSFGVGVLGGNTGVYYFDSICLGPCKGLAQTLSQEAGTGFIEEPIAKPEQTAFGSLEENTDRMGMNLRNFDLSSPDPLLCQQACAEEASCKAFTYVKPGYQGANARCYLKSGVPDATNNECCISGVRTEGITTTAQPGLLLPAVIKMENIPPNIQTSASFFQSGLEENTDRMGMNLRSFDLSSPDPLLCQQACAEDANCRAFTYVKPGYQGANARCYLKSGIPDATNNECCISGVK
jgi:hypothetical protein